MTYDAESKKTFSSLIIQVAQNILIRIKIIDVNFDE